MIAAGLFEIPAYVLSSLYALTHSFAGAIALVAVLLMVIVWPLNLKSTKSMLEMQRLAPEQRRLQNEYRNDRQAMNQEMMKLYQEHGVNPMASCLPMLAQAPIFFIMFRILHALTYQPANGNKVIAQAVLNAAGDTSPIGFLPRYLDHGSQMYQDLARSNHMTSLGLDLSKSAVQMLDISTARGILYVAMVALLGGLYLVQQRMVAARAAVSPTMSPAQQKLMQYMPVGFALFQLFFLLALVIYYLVQTVLRIAQQWYITKRFYEGEDSLGRQAQAAGERARELAKEHGDTGGGPLARARKELAAAKQDGRDNAGKGAAKGAVKSSNKTTTSSKKDSGSGKSGSGKSESAKSGSAKSGSAKSDAVAPSKRTTAPKGRPTTGRDQSSSRAGGRPTSRSGKRRNRTEK